MAERLYGVAAEFAALTGVERLFDLFCGIGTLGLSMASRAGEVWGIEVVPDAIVDAEENARINGISNAQFRAGDARTQIRPLLEEAGRPDVVVVDPPSRRPLRQDRPPADRVRGPADRLRLLQPDDARPERRPTHGGRI